MKICKIHFFFLKINKKNILQCLGYAVQPLGVSIQKQPKYNFLNIFLNLIKTRDVLTKDNYFPESKRSPGLEIPEPLPKDPVDSWPFSPQTPAALGDFTQADVPLSTVELEESGSPQDSGLG